MSLDIDGKIPADSIVTRNTLKRYNARKGDAGSLIVEVLSEIPLKHTEELWSKLSRDPNEHVEIWERYCERIAIMRNGDKDEPTDEQKTQAMKDAINPPEYPVTDENAHEIHVEKYIIEKKPEAEKVEENQIEISETPKDEKPHVIVLPSQPEETDDAEQVSEIEKIDAETVRKAEANELTFEDVWAGVKARTDARRAAEAKNVD